MLSLRFLLDENIPRSVKMFLEDKGFLVEFVPKGVEDSAVMLFAKEKKAVLLTRDSDFANLVLYPPEDLFWNCCVSNTSSQTGQELCHYY